MPYVESATRGRLIAHPSPWNAGELNYLLTRTIRKYLDNLEAKDGGVRYQHLNDVLGALEGAKQEFYRRVVVPYEDRKAMKNGDVY